MKKETYILLCLFNLPIFFNIFYQIMHKCIQISHYLLFVIKIIMYSLFYSYAKVQTFFELAKLIFILVVKMMGMK